MKILFTGNGTSGSWQIRGRQLGWEMGGMVVPKAKREHIEAVDAVIVVKRVPDSMLNDLRESGKPWFYDMVDFYPQPECSSWDKRQSIDWANKRLAYLNPMAVIWPNNRIAEDVGFSGRSLVLPHHCWPRMGLNPVRARIKKVGYEGEPNYLAEWRPLIEKECKRRGWRFVVNPKNLADVDVILALRGGQWNGYCQRHWKSNVKLTNAHGSGTPFIGCREDGYLELATGAEFWADSEPEFIAALDSLESQEVRQKISDKFVKRAFRIDKAASILRRFVGSVVREIG